MSVHGSSSSSEPTYRERAQARRDEDPQAQAEYEEALARAGLLADLIQARGESTQTDVGDRMGTTQSAVSDLERGKTDPGLTTLGRWARAVDQKLSFGLTPTEGTPMGSPDRLLEETLDIGEEASVGPVVTALYRGQEDTHPPSQEDLQRITKLSGPVVDHMISSLRRSRWLTSDRSGHGEPERYGLRHDRGLVAGVSLSRGVARGIMTDLRAATTVAEGSIDLSSNQPREVVESIATLVQQLRADTPQGDSEVIGLGVTLAGLVDELGTVRFAPDLDNFDTEVTSLFPNRSPVMLEGELEARTRLRTVVSNDASALAVHEYLSQGEEQNVALVLMSRSGDGIGGGFVINREMARGLAGISGEIGHVIVDPEGELCRCGPGVRGCLETIASATAIIRETSRSHHHVKDLAAASALAQEGDEEAVRAFRNAGQALGRVLSNLVAFVGPHRLVILGPRELVEPDVHSSAETFLGEIEKVPLPFGVKLKPDAKVLDEYSEPRAAAAVAVANFLAQPRRWVPSIVVSQWTPSMQPSRAGGRGGLYPEGPTWFHEPLRA